MKLVLCLAAVCGLGAARAAADSLDNVGNVRLKGYLGSRLDRMIERHVGGTDVDYITACFREKTETRGWWQTEFWGKYMHSAVPYAVYADSPKIRADLARGVESVLATQEANGYIGNYPDALRCGEGWDRLLLRLRLGRQRMAQRQLLPHLVPGNLLTGVLL